jgi:outer membrane protein assembly factor BamB
VRHAAALALLLVGLAAAAARGAAGPSQGWLVYGNDPGRGGESADRVPATALRALWTRRLGGQITAQPLVARDVPSPGRSTVIVGTSLGTVHALDGGGRPLWHVRYGRASSTCHQLPGYGITGTPAIDADGSTVYVADAFGRLHALDLRTGRERAGWPVTLYPDPERELVWGALALVGGAVYVPTGALCDREMEGKVLRVEVDGAVSATWIAVPLSLGGGGGIWGWGGVSYDATRDTLLVATGNAFRGGSNIGAAFSESAGYGEQVVELDRGLAVRAASHPPEIRDPLDLDFVGSPLAITSRCGELVVVANKNGRVYAWRAEALPAGPIWSFRLPAPGTQPLLGQLAFARTMSSLVVASHTRLTRLDIDARCRPAVAWARPLGGLFNSSPTVSGGLVFVARSGGKPLLQAFDLRSGRVRLSAPIPHVSFVAPTVVGGRAYVVTMHGEVRAFALR